MDKTKWVVRPLTNKAQLPANNVSKHEKTLSDLKKGESIVIREQTKVTVRQILRDSTPNTLVPSPEELVGQLFKRFTESDKPSGYDILHFYISGTTDAVRRILHKQNIWVTTRPLKTLQRMFPSRKHQVPPEKGTNVIYNIPCSDCPCPWSYVGETGRSF